MSSASRRNSGRLSLGTMCSLLRIFIRWVRTFALAILWGESADPIQSANLLREITALHPDISALVIESSAGWARGAAGRTATVALVAEVSAAVTLASLPAATLPSLRSALARALAMPGEDSRALRLRLQQHMEAGDADTNDAPFACHALDILTEDQRAQDAIEDLEADRRPPCYVRAPIYRSRRGPWRHRKRLCKLRSMPRRYGRPRELPSTAVMWCAGHVQ
jgi:hypothetical protein